MINWNINVGSPLLGNGMSFQVRYRKIGIDNWVNFLPNPTTNNFTIPNLEDGNYEAEIRTVCQNGALSSPVFHTTIIKPDNQSATSIRLPITVGIGSDNSIWWSCPMNWSDIINKTVGTIEVTSISDIYNVESLSGINVNGVAVPINQIILSGGSRPYSPFPNTEPLEMNTGYKHNVIYRNGAETLYFKTDLYIP